MAWFTPTVEDLVARTRSAFAAHLPGADAWSPANNIGPTAKVIGQENWPLFGKLGWVARQALLGTADDRDWVERHCAQYAIFPRPAAPASGSVTLTAVDAVTIAAGAVFVRGDGVQYQAIAGVALSAPGAADFAVQALAAAAAGNLDAGAPLVALSGVSGPGAATALFATAAGGIVGGLDLESTEDLKARGLFRLQSPPQGGAASDYVLWCQAVTGVSRVFVERLWAGPGTVRVFPLLDALRPGGIPTLADLAAIRAALDPVIPAEAGVTLAAAIPHPIAVTVNALDAADTPTQSAVSAALAAVIRVRGRVAGSDSSPAQLPYIATAFSFSRSWLAEAASAAAGEARHRLLAPADDVAIAAGEVPTLGTVSFT